MQLRYLYILLFASAALVGCRDDAVEPSGEAQRCYLTLSLNIPADEPLTRAGGDGSAPEDSTWGTQSYKWEDTDTDVRQGTVNSNPGEDKGTTYDNAFDPRTLQVFLLRASDNVVLCEVHNDFMYRYDKEPNHFKYRGWVDLQQQEAAHIAPAGTYKILVLLNHPRRYTGMNRLRDFYAQDLFSWYDPNTGIMPYGASSSSSTTTTTPPPYDADLHPHIPQSGIREYYIEFQPGKEVSRAKNAPTDTETREMQVFLLRAVSKIVIKLDRSLQKTYELNPGETYLPLANFTGHCFPGDRFTSITSTTQLKRQTEAFHPIDDAREDQRPMMPFFAEGGIDTIPYTALTYYVPEMTNTTSLMHGIDVGVHNLKTGKYLRYEQGIQFQYVDDYYEIYNAETAPTYPSVLKHKGDPYNLTRNYEYIYTITSITEPNNDDGMRFTVTIGDMQKGGDWTYLY